MKDVRRGRRLIIASMVLYVLALASIPLLSAFVPGANDTFWLLLPLGLMGIAAICAVIALGLMTIPLE